MNKDAEICPHCRTPVPSLTVGTRSISDSFGPIGAIAIVTLLVLVGAAFWLSRKPPAQVADATSENHSIAAVPAEEAATESVEVAKPAGEVNIKSVEATKPAEVRSFTSAEEAKRVAVRKFPELGIAGSKFNNAFLARHKLYQQTRPDYFRDPSWPMRLAEEVSLASESK